jgi:IS30 family transposase
LIATLLPDRKANTFNTAAIPVYTELPKHLCRTLTLDNGKEFSQFKDLETQTGLSVFFADAYSSWQRGTNENTNGFTALLFSQGDKLQAHLSRGLGQSRSTNQQQTEKMPWLPDTPGSLR